MNQLALFRAFVALPDALCLGGARYQERTVFFQAEYNHHIGSNAPAARTLEQLLTLAWGVDATGWCEDGAIYNITRERDLLEQAVGDGDTRLLEIGWGGMPRIHYAKRADVDVFVMPRDRARIEAAFDQIAAQAVPA